jgi:hypothetical protein
MEGCPSLIFKKQTAFLYFILYLGWNDEAVLILPIQMLISSKNTLTDTQEIT